MREIAFEHLRARLLEAEEVVKAAAPTIEALATVTIQIDPPTPTATETALVSIGLPEQLAPPASPVPERIFQEEEKGIDIFSPHPKRPATQSPTPAVFASDGPVYPPVHHGPTESHSRPFSVGAQSKRGRPDTRSATVVASPTEASPPGTSRFILEHLTPSRSDSPLQDRTTRVKKSKSGGTKLDQGKPGVAQDLSKQFDNLAEARGDPPAFPQ